LIKTFVRQNAEENVEVNNNGPSKFTVADNVAAKFFTDRRTLLHVQMAFTQMTFCTIALAVEKQKITS